MSDSTHRFERDRLFKTWGHFRGSQVDATEPFVDVKLLATLFVLVLRQRQ